LKAKLLERKFSLCLLSIFRHSSIRLGTEVQAAVQINIVSSCLYYPVFLHCTTVLNFSVLIHYTFSFTSLTFKFYITVCTHVFSLYVWILYFNLFWNCICNFVIKWVYLKILLIFIILY
jgi:hypothetical protein